MKYSHINYAHYGKLYPQNAERILTIDSVTLVHPMYIHLFQRLGRRKQARKQTTRKIEKKHRKKYLSSKQFNYQTADKQPQSYVDKCEEIIVAVRNCTYK